MPTARPPAVLPLVLALLGVLLPAVARADSPPAPAPRRAPTALAARFVGASQAVIAGRPVEVHPRLRAFYEARRWRPAFGDDAVRQALLHRLADAPADGLGRADVGADDAAWASRRLARAERRQGSNTAALRTDLDLLLADGFLRYGDALLGRAIDPTRLYGAQWIPAQRRGDPAVSLSRALAANDPAGALADALDAFAPRHAEYAALRGRLRQLRRAVAMGWLPLAPADTLATGDRSAWVPALRGRLGALGFAAPSPAADPYRFDSTLAQALTRFQAFDGLPATGQPDSTTLRSLNRRPDSLLTLLALNLERWRWLPDSLGERHVLVNLPSFRLQVRERQADVLQTVLDMPAAIGTPHAGSWTTPVLSDRIREIVFQPPWYVPPSIAAASIFPAARADSGTTLTGRGFETYYRGGRVDPAALDWETVTAGDLRFVQRPGRGNPLGRVKFVMPNPYFILIHDTNKPWEFEEEVRAFSNGCIHAGDPIALAQYVLGVTNGAPPAAVEGAYRGWSSQTMTLNEGFPVHLVYFTAWPESDGTLRFYRDVYGHDPALIRAMGERKEDGV